MLQADVQRDAVVGQHGFMLASTAAAHLATSTQAPGQCLADLQLVGAGVSLQCLQESQAQGPLSTSLSGGSAENLGESDSC
jgi:hypothetical protein